MKSSLVFLGLFAIDHAVLAFPAGGIGGPDILNGDMMRRLYDRAPIYVAPNNGRNLGENMETRQSEIGEAMDILGTLADVIQGVVGIISLIDDENDKRTQFTQDTVNQSSTEWPAFNWVICHPAHQTAFDGTEGADWGHYHHELPMLIGTIGYDIYWFRSGTFTLNGDGGYINWAYVGYDPVRQAIEGGSVVHFTSPD